MKNLLYSAILMLISISVAVPAPFIYKPPKGSTTRQGGEETSSRTSAGTREAFAGKKSKTKTKMPNSKEKIKKSG
jgi:hypothetical protein